jgi:phage shock protein A
MIAKMQSAQARIKVQEQLDGLSVDEEVRALDNVRTHIKNTIAEANLGKELSESSLDSRLAALRNQTGDVQARKQLADLKAKKAAQQGGQGQRTM